MYIRLTGPEIFQEFAVPIFQNNRPMKVVNLFDLRTGHIYLQGHNAVGNIVNEKFQ